MTKVNFPARNEDGSFCVEIWLGLSGNQSDDLPLRVQRWIREDWMPEHATWKREWRTGPNLATTYEQVLHYQDEFTKPPVVSYRHNAKFPFRVLRLRFSGKQSAKFWKDWLVSRLLPDLRERFPHVSKSLYYIGNWRD